MRFPTDFQTGRRKGRDRYLSLVVTVFSFALSRASLSLPRCRTIDRDSGGIVTSSLASRSLNQSKNSLEIIAR